MSSALRQRSREVHRVPERSPEVQETGPLPQAQRGWVGRAHPQHAEVRVLPSLLHRASHPPRGCLCQSPLSLLQQDQPSSQKAPRRAVAQRPPDVAVPPRALPDSWRPHSCCLSLHFLPTPTQVLQARTPQSRAWPQLAPLITTLTLISRRAWGPLACLMLSSL